MGTLCDRQLQGSKQHRLGDGAASVERVKDRHAIRAANRGLASMVNDLALSFAAAREIAG
jgi:hypothetical protein